MPKKIDPLEAAAIPHLAIPEKGFKDYPDGKGLRLRVWDTGTRTWMFRYTVKATGQTRLMKLGTWPELGLSDARTDVEDLRTEVRRGADPIGDVRQSRPTARDSANGADSLGALINTYLADHAAKNLAPRTQAEYRRVLEGEDIQALRRMPATEVTDADVARWLDRIEKRGAMTLCNRAQTYLSAVYTWAAPRRRMGVVSSPVRGLPRRYNERGKNKRWLTEDEIGTAFGALPGILVADRPDVPRWAADALWLILATGQRPGEVLQLKWDHITLPPKDDDDQRGEWAMPSGYRKRVRGQREAPAHDVPLSSLVVERLRAIPNKRGFVFPAKRGHKDTTALNQRVKRGLLKHIDGESFSPHDLRRTASTHLHKAGVPRHIVEKTLGHVDSSVAGVYDRHAYWDERTAALDAWAERLREIVNRER